MKTRKRKYTRGGASNEKSNPKPLTPEQLEMAKNISEVISVSREQYMVELNTLYDTRAIRLIQLISLHKEMMNEDDKQISKMKFETKKDKKGNDKQVVHGYDLAYLLLTKDQPMDAELSSLLEDIKNSELYDVERSWDYFGKHNPKLYNSKIVRTPTERMQENIERYTVQDVLARISKKAQELNDNRLQLIQTITGTVKFVRERKFKDLLKGCVFKDPFIKEDTFKAGLTVLDDLNLCEKHKEGFEKLFTKHWEQGAYAREHLLPFENESEHIRHSDASYEHARKFTIKFYKDQSKSKNVKENLTEEDLVKLMTNSLFISDSIVEREKEDIIYGSREYIKEFLLNKTANVSPTQPLSSDDFARQVNSGPVSAKTTRRFRFLNRFK